MAQIAAGQITDSASVRDYLTHALRLDLIGPRPEDAELAYEMLPHAPSRWYLTGFLVPSNAPESQRAQDAEEEFDQPDDPFHGSDDGGTPDRGSAKRNFFPSSIGMSILVTQETKTLDVSVAWGDYAPEEIGEVDQEAVDAGASSEVAEESGDDDSTGLRFGPWRRTPMLGSVSIDLSTLDSTKPVGYPIQGSGGMQVVCLARATNVPSQDGSQAGRAVSVFVVNRREPADDNLQDKAYAFQAEITVEADQPLIARANLHGLDSEDWDERLADLHFGDVVEYAVGHNVSTSAHVDDGECRRVSTEWMPRTSVDRTVSAPIDQVEFRMETLGAVADGAAAKLLLDPLVQQYRTWIEGQGTLAEGLTGRRKEVAVELVSRATRVADRIQAGIDLLSDPDVLEAFRVANRAMAASGRRRRALENNVGPDEVDPPEWHPFQLAYILMNLRSIAEPTHFEREIVDLLFFPTGGGKTEAYLGLAAFTLVLRRLRNPDPVYRGLSVLMRYTLRLLTLDQLGRAAAMICALELEREQDPVALGEWSFEIGLWVGRAATPNYMGRQGDRSGNSARVRTLRYAQDTSRPQPLPLEECPWCGERFSGNSFQLEPNTNEPTDLWVSCASRHCDFSRRKRHLPIVAVDEPIYRRLPAFMIATADKFAALPWSGETARFFRGGDPSNPRPPDLIIQDELHLISGPLGSMAGIYETAIDHLCRRQVDGQVVRPKVIASTATVRLASKQIRALFNRHTAVIFPAPGVDRRDSFFAKQVEDEPDSARAYVGVAAQGRGPKVIFLRSMTTLMSGAQAAWNAAGGSGTVNPADPYMTAVVYFNALRELGSARRIVEDEINSRLLTYSERKRVGEADGLFDDRHIAFEPVELTSRVDTAKVADAKRKLALDFTAKERVDVALATNMISVGLDIIRLGLMLVSGQPKSTAEYIQATSRVGRDPQRPGLVVTLLNIHKPRDRSHYERYANYHESFYRGVEATSVTPFSSGAMDRALPAITVALVRLGIEDLTPTLSARQVESHGSETKLIADAISDRAGTHAEFAPPGLAQLVRLRVQSLIDDWAHLAHEAGQDGIAFGYARRDAGVSTPLLREMIDPDRNTLTPTQLRFRAPRSLRDVEPNVLLAIKTPEGQDLN